MTPKPATPVTKGLEGRAPFDDAYLPIRALTAYAGLSVRTLRSHLVHPVRPLPHYRVGGKVLVKRSEFDAWMYAFRRAAYDQRAAADAIETTALAVLRGRR